MICMGARRKSSPGPLLILFTTNLRTRTVACMAVHVMHAPCIHLNSSVHTYHMRTDPHRYMHRYDHIHYRIASHAHRLSRLGAYDKRAGGSAARGAASRLQTLLTCASGRAARHPPSSASHRSDLAAAAPGPAGRHGRRPMRLHPIQGCKRRLSAMQHLRGEHRAIARSSEV